ACDGWLTAPGNRINAIGYYEASDVAFLGRAAPAWTVLDRYFAPFLGPTYANRLISQAAQTDRLSNTLIASTLPAIWDRLSAAGFSGRNYGYSLTTTSLWGSRYASLKRPISDFFNDAASGSLPDVAFVDPDFLKEPSNSYHWPGDIRDGEAFLAGIYGAVTRSPAWSSTLLIVTFDEWGGFFDHVPPPVAPIPAGERMVGNLDGLRGFRVPTILISPFARRGAVSSAVYDHTSILRLIEWRWSLAPLSVRDAQANNIADALDFANPQLSAPAIEVPAGPFGVPCG
ncbi:MAG TPA: alkaline phosphatase family protein, partial [Gemmatimonadaceae bacterium]